MLKNSIVAGAVARKFVTGLPQPFRARGAFLNVGKYTFDVFVAMSTHRGSQACRISVRLTPVPSYDSGYPREWELSKRLRKSDSETIYRHVADLCERLRAKRADLLISLRERVYELSETRAYDVDSLPRESSCFSEMSEEECKFWLTWLEQQPRREVA
jgi:hypothetical protein